MRLKILRGGAFLTIRQVLGMVVSLAGVLLVTRVIGPRQYGIYAVAMGIFTFVCAFGTWGIDVYLLRGTERHDEDEFHQAFTLLLGVSAVLCVVLCIASSAIASFVRISAVTRLVILLAAGVPFNLMAIPAIVKLDRNLNFRQVAVNELASQTSMYVVAIPMAFIGCGAWAPASGFITQQIVLALLSYRSVGYWPSLHWDSGLAMKMMRYGLSYSSSTWVWQLRGLVNPLVVGHFAGAEAVGYVALSIRLVEALAFAKNATWRIAMAALAKMCDQRVRLRNNISEGMRLQAMAVGLPLATFAIAAPFLVACGLGNDWAPALVVFPFIGLAYLSNAMFNLHCSVLYLLNKNYEVTVFNAVHVAIFAGGALLLVPHLGFRGYGWAEVLALLGYPLIHWYLTRAVESPSYQVAGVWFITVTCVLALSTFGPLLRYAGILLLLAPLCSSKERACLAGYRQVMFPRIFA